MYASWSERRGMRIMPLRPREPGERLFAVSGLGAYTILKEEAGIHVLETPKDNRRFSRMNVHVSVAARRPIRPDVDPREECVRALGEAALPRGIVRRYRRDPSPLVRDTRGWRTGRIERVLAGDFDVMGAVGAGEAQPVATD